MDTNDPDDAGHVPAALFTASPVTAADPRTIMDIALDTSEDRICRLLQIRGFFTAIL